MNNHKADFASLPQYPLGSRLLRDDERFWVSLGPFQEVMVFILASDLPKNTPLKDIFSGLHVFVDHRSEPAKLVIQLEDKAILNKFLTVIEYISVESKHTPDDQLYYFVIKKLHEWSAFLRPKQEGMSDNELTGIFGELYVLHEYYLSTYDKKLAIEYFLGPSGAPQDFGGVNQSLEIKTSTQKNPKNLHITSLDQLNTSQTKSAIALIQVDKSNKGLSCSSLVSSVEESLKYDLVTLMNFQKIISDKLEAATKEQLDQMFEIADEHCWRIADGFPMLTPQNVPEGVVRAEYSIGIQWLNAFKFANGVREFLDG